jgi:ABC-type nitrate/sulfonate/bicarbonate transport system substrate-binding protein
MKILLCIALILVATTAFAADHLRVGKPEARAFDFTPVEIGSENGIFAKYGIETESIGFGGGGKMHQAMAAHQLDIALGSGPEMASIAKGSPEMTVAAMFGAPMNISIIVKKDSPITKIEQLKGKTVGAGPKNSLTGWTALETARRQGWGPGGIRIADTGGRPGIIAALLTGNVDAGVDGTEDAYELQAQGKVRILVRMGDVIPDFLGHVIFASNDLIEKDPALVRRFLKAWFETIAFMEKNEAATVKAARLWDSRRGRVFPRLKFLDHSGRPSGRPFFLFSRWLALLSRSGVTAPSAALAYCRKPGPPPAAPLV